jgi:hypothetical protein
MMAHDALTELLSEIFSSSSVIISTDQSEILLQSARTSTIPQLVELLLNILFSQSPFEHNTSSVVPLASHRKKFFAIWSNDNEQSNSRNSATIVPTVGLSLLSSFRLEFQRLSESCFSFIAELLLSCLQRLSPETSGRSLNIRGWVDAHEIAVTVLSELLHAVPAADWTRLDEQADCIAPVWKCLQLLCSGASWFSMESPAYRENMTKLAMRICK